MAEVLANSMEAEKETSSLSQEEASEKSTSALDSPEDLRVEEQESAAQATTDLDEDTDVDADADVDAQELDDSDDPDDLDDPDEPMQIASRSVALEDSGVIPMGPALQGKNGATALSVLEENGAVAQRNPYKSASMLSAQGDGQQPSVGYMLSYFRKQSGQTIQDVAKQLCVRPTTIADIEADKLNYRTCMEFTSNVIQRYANHIDLKPDLMVEMYLQQVLKNDPDIDSDSQAGNKNKGAQRKKLLLGLLGLLAVAGGAYYWLALREPSHEELVASTNGSENLEPLDSAFSLTPIDNNVVASSNSNEIIDLGHISDDTVAAAQAANAAKASANAAQAANAANATGVVVGAGQDNAPQVVIETDGNPFLADNNVNTTEKTVGANEKKAESPKVAETPVLSLPREVPTRDGKGVLGANIDQGPTLVDGPINANNKTNTSAQDSRANKNKVDQQLKTASEQMQALQNQSNAATANDTLAAKVAKDNAAANAAKANSSAAANNEAAESAAKPIALDNKLKNISSRVKIVNRDALGSLNRVNITVNSEVSLRVLDSNKKVLVQGAYKKGDTVTATGIPPLTVQASNTRALEISYSGGQLRMPREQQVQFELPMR